MAKLIVEDTPIGPCPCGNGQIIHHTAEMDHGYGTDSSWYYISCGECNNKWDIDSLHQVLVSKGKPAERRPLRGA